MKFVQAQISRKLMQATTSHRKLAVERDTSMHKLKTCDDLRSRLSNAYMSSYKQDRYSRNVIPALP